MNLELGQAQFEALVKGIDQRVIPEFLRWVKDTAGELLTETQHSNADVCMRRIQEDLRGMLPLNATLPSEHIVLPSQGHHEGLEAASTVHVDGFLYEDDVVDTLCDDGKMSRNYCTQCGSHQVAPLTFISHSTSLSQLHYIFQYLLPDLTGKTLVDVGSRTGAVLYSAYLYSSAPWVVGVEMNPDFCAIQQQVLDKYAMSDRVKVVCDDICNQADLLQQADVVVMNNVFEFFVPVDIQQRIWRFLRETLRKPGCLLVLSSSMRQSITPLQMDLDMDNWVSECDVTQQRAAAYKRLLPDADPDCDDLDDLHLYAVKSG